MSLAFALPTILVVDDTPNNIDILGRLLQPEYRVKVAPDGPTALTVAKASPKPDLILLDVMMPGMDGYEVCRRLKADPATAGIPIIFVSARGDTEDETQGLDLGAADYIHKPFNPTIVLARVRAQLALYNQNQLLEARVRQRTEEVQRVRLEIIHRLGRAAEFRDNETGLHVIRMSHYSRIIAERLGVADDWADLLFNAAPMHDVGKIGIPDSILLKPGPLNAAEWDVMRRHPEIGAAIIGDDASDLLRMSRDIARCHHEQWDGSGYPQGLAGDAIPLAARIVTVADVFDALTTARPYKLAWRKADAIAYIVQQAGRQFDPDAVAAFTAVLDRIEETMERYKETGPSPPAYGHPTLKGRGDLVGSAGGRRTQGFSAA